MSSKHSFRFLRIDADGTGQVTTMDSRRTVNPVTGATSPVQVHPTKSAQLLFARMMGCHVIVRTKPKPGVRPNLVLDYETYAADALPYARGGLVNREGVMVRSWPRQMGKTLSAAAYGGKLVENLSQSTAAEMALRCPCGDALRDDGWCQCGNVRVER
jgi:hypothetical protein